MRSIHSNSPTLLLDPVTACPRCNGPHVLALAERLDSSFAWRECEDCAHLWAIPRGWTPHAESPPPQPLNGMTK